MQLRKVLDCVIHEKKKIKRGSLSAIKLAVFMFIINWFYFRKCSHHQLLRYALFHNFKRKSGNMVIEETKNTTTVLEVNLSKERSQRFILWRISCMFSVRKSCWKCNIWRAQDPEFFLQFLPHEVLARGFRALYLPWFAPPGVAPQKMHFHKLPFSWYSRLNLKKWSII